MTGYHVLLRSPRRARKLSSFTYVSDMGNTGTDLNARYGFHVKAKNAHVLSDVPNFARIDT